MIYTNLNTFQNAVNTAKPGDIVELKPGTYDGDVQLNYRGSEDVNVIMHGVTLNYKDGGGHYTLDLIGEHIHVEADELKLNGGKIGVLGIRGHNLTIKSDLNGYVTGDQLGGDLFGTNNHVQGLNFDNLGNVGMSAKGFPLDEDRNHPYPYPNGVFGWYPSHNWRVTQCRFANIEPVESGDAGGGFRLIPHVKDVIVDNCLFENIKGSGLWGDHNQKGFEFYYNTFRNIQTADTFGKALFLEIMDPDPKDKSGFVAKIAGNTFINCDTQTILIAASSGQNPAGIDVFGNTIIGGWGIVAGAMPRQFKRRWSGKSDKSGWEAVDAQLKNIRIRQNVIMQTTGRNHIAIHQGKNSGLIEIDNNYYVVGHDYTYTRPSGVVEEGKVLTPQIYASEKDDEGLFIHGKSNAANLDKNPVVGELPDLDNFPFPEALSEIPVQKVNLELGTIDIPVNDNVIDDDPIIDDLPTYYGGGNRTIITTDLSDGQSDWDDWEAMAIALTLQDYAAIEKIIIASAKIKNTGALKAFNKIIKPAYEDAQQALNATYGNYFRDLDVMEASSNGEGFLSEPIDLDKYPSTRAIIDEIRPDDILTVQWWGTGGECANAAKWIEDNDPSLMDNIQFVSHAASLPTHNNYKKDKAAAEYMESIGRKYGNYYSLGFSGKVIDGKHNYPLIKIADHGTKLGKLTRYKHSHVKGPKTDASDSIAFIVPFVFEFGGGAEYMQKLDGSGKSNEAKIKSDFAELRPNLFPFLSARYKAVSDYNKGNGGPVIDDPDTDPVIDDPITDKPDSKLNQALAGIRTVIEMLEDLEKELV